jgi:hypothetical protein
MIGDLVIEKIKKRHGVSSLFFLLNQYYRLLKYCLQLHKFFLVVAIPTDDVEQVQATAICSEIEYE